MNGKKIIRWVLFDYGSFLFYGGCFEGDNYFVDFLEDAV